MEERSNKSTTNYKDTFINLEFWCKSIEDMNNDLVNTKLIKYNISFNDFPDRGNERTCHSSTLSIDESKVNELVTKKAPQIDLKKNTLNFTNRLKSNIKRNLFGIQDEERDPSSSQ